MQNCAVSTPAGGSNRHPAPTPKVEPFVSPTFRTRFCESGAITARMRRWRQQDSCVQYPRRADQIRRPVVAIFGSADFHKRPAPPSGRQDSLRAGIHDAWLTRALRVMAGWLKSFPCTSHSTELVFSPQICWPRSSNRVPRLPAVRTGSRADGEVRAYIAPGGSRNSALGSTERSATERPGDECSRPAKIGVS